MDNPIDLPPQQQVPQTSSSSNIFVKAQSSSESIVQKVGSLLSIFRLRKFLIILAFIIIAVAVPLTVLLSGQRQDIRQRASYTAPSLTRCTNVSAPQPSTVGVVGIAKVSYPDCNSNINAAMQQIAIAVGNTTANNQFQEIPITTAGNGLFPGQQHTVRLSNVPAGYGVGYTACDMQRSGQCRTNLITPVNLTGNSGSFTITVPSEQSVVDVAVYLAPPSDTPTPTKPVRTAPATATATPTESSGPIITSCTASPTTVNVGETVTYTMSLTGRGNPNWDWSSASGFVLLSPSAGALTITARYTNAGVKRVAATASGAYGTDSRDCTPVTVNPAPTATLTPTTGPGRSIRVITPNGGNNETLTTGQPYTITWAQNRIAKVFIDYVYSGGNTLSIASNLQTSGATGSFNWTVPSILAGKTGGKIDILGYEVGVGSTSDRSDNGFTIVAPLPPLSVTVTQPNGGENLTTGQPYTIEWTQSRVDKVKIWYVHATPGDVTELTPRNGDGLSTSGPNGTFSWTPPVTFAGKTGGKIRILGYQTGVDSREDDSDGTFTIAALLTNTPTPTPTPTPTGSISASPTTCSVATPTAVCTVQVTANANVPYLIMQNGRVIHTGDRNVQEQRAVFPGVGRTSFALTLRDGATMLQYVDVNVVYTPPTNTPVPPTAIPTPTPVPPPPPPTPVSASPGCNGRGYYMELTWRGPAEADSFDIAYGSNNTLITSGIVDGRYVITSALTGNITFKVRSSRAGSKSVWVSFAPINQWDCTNPSVPTATNTPVPPTAVSCTRTQGGYRENCVASATIADDLTFWIQEVRKSNPSTLADYNGDGRVNTLDFNVWYQKRYQ